MIVQDIMTRRVATVLPPTPFKDLVQLMLAREVSGIPVVDEAGKLVGMITEADLIAKPAYCDRRNRFLAVLSDLASGRDQHWATKSRRLSAEELMTRDVVSCDPSDSIAVAARRMLSHHVKRLPVVKDDALVGIVSRRDILSSFDRSDATIAADVGRLVDGADMPTGHHVRAIIEDGVVTLKGDVQYNTDIDVFVDNVRDIPGVVQVVNQLTWRRHDPRRPFGFD
jgi:CBS domain-containing protein